MGADESQPRPVNAAPLPGPGRGDPSDGGEQFPLTAGGAPFCPRTDPLFAEDSFNFGEYLDSVPSCSVGLGGTGGGDFGGEHHNSPARQGSALSQDEASRMLLEAIHPSGLGALLLLPRATQLVQYVQQLRGTLRVIGWPALVGARLPLRPQDNPDDPYATGPAQWAVTPFRDWCYDMDCQLSEGAALLPDYLQIAALATFKEFAMGPRLFEELLLIKDNRHGATALHRLFRCGNLAVISWVCGTVYPSCIPTGIDEAGGQPLGLKLEPHQPSRRLLISLTNHAYEALHNVIRCMNKEAARHYVQALVNVAKIVGDRCAVCLH